MTYLPLLCALFVLDYWKPCFERSFLSNLWQEMSILQEKQGPLLNVDYESNRMRLEQVTQCDHTLHYNLNFIRLFPVLLLFEATTFGTVLVHLLLYKIPVFLFCWGNPYFLSIFLT